MAKFALDTEFNDFGGELISLALVGDNGAEFYEVLPCFNPRPWVAQHVIPVLGRPPLNGTVEQTTTELTRRLGNFLTAQKSPVHIFADWPDDVRYFCAALITGPGTAVGCRHLMTFTIDRTLPSTASMSEIPHNALEDARALARHLGFIQ